MPALTEEQRQHIIALLENGESLPAEFKYLLFPAERQEYELVYAGKEREEDILAETMAVPLQPIRSFGGNGVDWHNKLILGDNLQVMKTLLRMKEQGKLINADGTSGVKLIYIDPPFATKQEFRGTQDERAYQDKVIGARFLEFIRKRLVLMKELLTDDGSIYIHMDWRKVHYVKGLADEIFGENRFRNEVIWKRTSAHSDSSTYGNVHDMLLFYTKSDNFTFNPQYTDYTDEYVEERYKHVDKDGRRFADDNLIGTGLKGGGYVYEWKGITKNWRCPIETMQQYEKEDKLYYTKNGVARIKRYIDTLPGKPTIDMWLDIFPVNSQAAERVDYPTQKPESLLKLVIASSSNPGDLVLDAFAGSGTTLAVSEKLGRRWIGIDCGKLAMYTIQKRMLHLKSEIGNKGKAHKIHPFTLYSAGLYDFSYLRSLPWEGWRSYALSIFQCKDEPHKIGGVELDGRRGTDDVLVFNHRLGGGVALDYGFIDDLHSQLGNRIGSRFFIIAPASSVAFLEDYVQKGRTRYYILRIPYSIINELHSRDFSALVQPVDETEVNATVEAVGFDFIRQPKVNCDYFVAEPKGELFKNAVVKIHQFQSQAMAKGASQKGNLETLSMVLVDYDYPYEPNRKGQQSAPPFEVDAVFYASEIQNAGWEVRMPLNALGKCVMLLYVDVYGNEYAEVKTTADFGIPEQSGESHA